MRWILIAGALSLCAVLFITGCAPPPPVRYVPVYLYGPPYLLPNGRKCWTPGQCERVASVY